MSQKEISEISWISLNFPDKNGQTIIPGEIGCQEGCVAFSELLDGEGREATCNKHTDWVSSDTQQKAYSAKHVQQIHTPAEHLQTIKHVQESAQSEAQSKGT